MDLFPPSIAFVFGNETFVRQGKVVSLFEDPKTGEVSNWGISLAWFRGLKPQATAENIRAITKEGATYLYRGHFWEPAHLGAIALPSIAARVLDAEVNMGGGHGVSLLQAALCVEADGVLGPVTAAACNAADEAKLYASFVFCAADRYRRIHDTQIAKYGQGTADKNLSQWLARLAKRPAAVIS